MLRLGFCVNLVVIVLILIIETGKNYDHKTGFLKERLLDIKRENEEVENSVHMLCSAPVIRNLIPTAPRLHVPVEDTSRPSRFDVLSFWTQYKNIWAAYSTYEAEALEWNAAFLTQPSICTRQVFLLSEEEKDSSHKEFMIYVSQRIIENFMLIIYEILLFIVLLKMSKKTPLKINGNNFSETISTSDVPQPSKTIVPVILNNECKTTVQINGHLTDVLFDSDTTYSVMSLTKAQEFHLTPLMSKRHEEKIQLFTSTETYDTWLLPPIDVELNNNTKIKVRFVVQKDGSDEVLIGTPEIDHYGACFKFNREEGNVSLYLNKNHKKVFRRRGQLEYYLNGSTELEGDDTFQLNKIAIDTGADVSSMQRSTYEKINKINNSWFSWRSWIIDQYPSFFDGQVKGNHLEVHSLPGIQLVLGLDLFYKYNCTIDFGKKNIFFQLDESKTIRSKLTAHH